MNLLSLGAGFGALVWVFQEGHLGGLVGIEAVGALSITTPVLVFASRSGCRWTTRCSCWPASRRCGDATGDNDLAVAAGCGAPAGIITAAALLIAVVFAGFVAGGFSPVKQVGLGLVAGRRHGRDRRAAAARARRRCAAGPGELVGARPLRRLHARIGFTEERLPESDPVAVPDRRDETLVPAYGDEDRCSLSRRTNRTPMSSPAGRGLPGQLIGG